MAKIKRLAKREKWRADKGLSWRPPKRKPHPLGNNPRGPKYRGHSLFVSGAKDATNPFRPGSMSHAAFALVQTNPGILFEDAVAMGARQRTLTLMLKEGLARAVDQRRRPQPKPDWGTPLTGPRHGAPTQGPRDGNRYGPDKG